MNIGVYNGTFMGVSNERGPPIVLQCCAFFPKLLDDAKLVRVPNCKGTWHSVSMWSLTVHVKSP